MENKSIKQSNKMTKNHISLIFNIMINNIYHKTNPTFNALAFLNLGLNNFHFDIIIFIFRQDFLKIAN